MNGHRMNMGQKETSMYVLKLESKFLSNQEKRMSKIPITGEIVVRYFAVRPLLPATWHHSCDEWHLINTIWKAKTGEALGTRLVSSSAWHSLSSLYSIYMTCSMYAGAYGLSPLHTNTFRFMIHTLTHSVATWKVTHRVRGCSLRIMWKRFPHPLHHKLWIHMVEQYCLANHAIFIQNSF